MSDVYDIQGLKGLSDGDLALHFETMADLMEEHPAFKDQILSPCVPGPVKIREHSVEIKQASIAAKQDPSKEPELQDAREKGIQSVKFTCNFVVMYATHVNEPGLLDTIGMERSHRSSRSTGVKPPKRFEKFTVGHGEESGTVKIYVNKWEGKGSVEVQMCTGDPPQAESWRTIQIGHSCHMKLKGLEPAQRAYFRVRLITDAGNGPWSDVLELIII